MQSCSTQIRAHQVPYNRIYGKQHKAPVCIHVPQLQGQALRGTNATSAVLTDVKASAVAAPPDSAAEARPANGAESRSGETDPQLSAAAAPHFSWTRSWYPVAIVEDLSTEKPTTAQLLGKDLVLWRDGQGSWQAHEDVCPHRLAPLSEGRIEPSDGTLQCTYHGWRFNGQGQCVNIPQLSDEQALHNAVSSRKACVKQYPTQVVHGLLFVWGEAGPNALLESLQSQPAAVAELLEPEKLVIGSPWFMREVPFNADCMLENVVDPSHVSFSHHGIGPASRYKPSQYDMRLKDEVHPLRGFVVQTWNKAFGPADGAPSSEIDFVPPALARYTYKGGQMVTYTVPVRPGWCRTFYTMVGYKTEEARQASRATLLQRPQRRRWVDHLERNEVADGDAVFVHKQDLTMRGLKTDWRSRVYMPTVMDSAVLSLRKWLDGSAGPIPWPQGSESSQKLLPREQLLDRYHQHTQHCQACTGALSAFRKLHKVALGLLATLLFLAAAKVEAGTLGANAGSAIVTAGAAGAAVAAWQLQQMMKRFVFTDYLHAEK